ncbi:MAG TPA: RNA polymerase sigma factor [Longimicrobiales bacterium]
MSERERRERLRSPEQRVGTLTNGALPPPTDEELLERALIDGDEIALGQALGRLSPSMLHVAQYHVRSRADAEDVVQEAWLGALRGIHRFERRSTLRTWLFRILKNRARTRGARLARMVTFTDLEAATPMAGGTRGFVVDAAVDVHGVPAPERELIARELGERIHCAIATLPTRQRAVLTLRDVEGRSALEVRGRLGLTDANQRVLLHRARARIRDQLSDDDGSGRRAHGFPICDFLSLRAVAA